MSENVLANEAMYVVDDIITVQPWPDMSDDVAEAMRSLLEVMAPERDANFLETVVQDARKGKATTFTR